MPLWPLAHRLNGTIVYTDSEGNILTAPDGASDGYFKIINNYAVTIQSGDEMYLRAGEIVLQSGQEIGVRDLDNTYQKISIADPEEPQNAATKGYVDAAIASQVYERNKGNITSVDSLQLLDETGGMFWQVTEGRDIYFQSYSCAQDRTNEYLFWAETPGPFSLHTDANCVPANFTYTIDRNHVRVLATYIAGVDKWFLTFIPSD
jgi:hypothetical protein